MDKSVNNFIKSYLKALSEIAGRGDAREESFYPALVDLIKQMAQHFGKKQIDVTVLPKKTEAGNPDFRVWDGAYEIIGYIEAKQPETDLSRIQYSQQLTRYRDTFPNFILTDFYEFRLYRNGELVEKALLARPFVATKLGQTPPIEDLDGFLHLWERFFDFSLPKTYTAQSLAVELAKRTRFLRDLVLAEELEANPHSEVHGFYEVFRDNLIRSLTLKQFSDLYAQTITYGLFAARTRANGNFNRKLAFDYIPRSIGLLREIFKFISLGEPSKQMQVIIDEISQVLNVADIKRILQEYYSKGKGEDPILHFYETFLAQYDPEERERRGVYYTPEPVVKYIVRAVNKILKEKFGLAEGLANENVKLLDPAAGTMTFPAKAIEIAVGEHIEHWGRGDLSSWLRSHILQNYYAFELMMAPYAIGHLKIGFILEELGLHLEENERFKLYLTNTLELEDIKQTDIPILRSLSQESRAAGQVKRQEKILVIIGNPPYSGHSANTNEWTEDLLKSDVVEGVEIQSYYKVDGKDLGEKNPKWLQDDYVKFLRFAQWKIAQAGFGIVAMITNHSYLDNPTFRGMRQSLMKTFDEIYILNLHGNSLKRETTPEGGKDENVFDIRQGVAISVFVKHKEPLKEKKVLYRDLWGLREEKYKWLDNTLFSENIYERINPQSPWYFFIPFKYFGYYNNWIKISEIFPINGVGITTARDNFVIDNNIDILFNRVRAFKHSNLSDEELHKAFNIRKKKGWDIRKAWQMLQSLSDEELKKFIVPITYRPFDEKFIFWHDSLVWRTVKRIMRHMLAGENLGLVVGRQGQVVGGNIWNLIFISEKIIDLNLYYRGGAVLYPLYLYPDAEKKDLFSEQPENKQRKPNINEKLYQKLTETYGTQPTPEQILYYIYAVFYSNIYRERYAEFLKIDFPRVPFTADYEVFSKMADLGRQLADLHLLKSDLLSGPIAKFEGEGDNLTVDKVRYDEKNQRVYINKDKYFTGIYPELWNYYIGGYQVLNKWLKDRKGRQLTSDDIRHYIKTATALHHTILLQDEIDKLYPEVEKQVIEF